MKTLGDNLRLVVLGNRVHSQQIIRALLNDGRNVVGVIAAPDNDSQSQVGYTSFRDLCERHDIAYLQTEAPDADATDMYKNLSPDLCLCAGWTEIIPETILDYPREGTIGIHASSLPEGRGGAPVNWQMIHDEGTVGVSLFRLTSEVDHGDVLEQTTVEIESRDDISTVYNKVTVASIDLVTDFLNSLRDGSVSVTPQSFAEATYYPQRQPQDGIIDWGNPPQTQRDWIRAQTTPYPGAFTFYRGTKLRVWSGTVPSEQPTDIAPGEVFEIRPDCGLYVGTGDGVISLERVQYGNLPPMWGDQFARRLDVETGTKIGRPQDFPDWLYTGIRGPDEGIRYQTNVHVGETAPVYAVSCSHVNPREVAVTAELDGENISEESLTVRGWKSLPVHPVINSEGSHTLIISFSTDGSVVDRRRLKIYGRVT